jgi:Transposase DDE domain
VSSLAQVAQAIQTVLTDVPEDVARSTGFLKRRSKLAPARFVQTLVLGWWQHPEATLDQLSQMAAALGSPISPQGLDQRFGAAAARLLRDRLETAVAQVIAAEPVAGEVLRRFPAVYVLDSTTVALPDALAVVWPGCGGRVPQGAQAALKATVRLDLVRGGLAGPALSAGRGQDKSSPLQRAAVPAGALRIADQGFWSLAVLGQIAAGGGYFLSRLHLQTTVFVAGERIDPVRWLADRPGQEVDVAVALGVTAQVAARLLAVRVPQEVADRRRAKLREAAQRAGTVPNARALALADWTLLVTNAPADRLGVREALVLGRLRWQVELLIKLWKSGGRIDEWRSAKPWRVLCEVYAKLTAMVLQHWVLLVGCWAFADRSLARAAKTVRDAVPVLALGLTHLTLLVATLGLIARCLAAGCTVDKRCKHPSAFQLLADPDRCYA